MNIALTGNPNCGKTTLFNMLTGANQHVGNWSGVTVDIKEGQTQVGSTRITLVDLPGTYSLSAYSLEEKVARDYIVEQRPQVVINVLDASNLERHLYLTLQLIELGIRPLVVLNMWDEAQNNGLHIDTVKLARLLDTTVMATVGKTGAGVRDMMQQALKHAEKKGLSSLDPLHALPPELSSGVERLVAIPALSAHPHYPPRWLATKLLEHDLQIEQTLAHGADGEQIIAVRAEVEAGIEHLLEEDTESLIAETRYGVIAGILRETVRKTRPNRVALSDTIDTVLTHQFWAYPIFLGFMWLLFQATFVFGAYPMGWIESLIALLSQAAAALLPDGPLEQLITEGIIGGVGSVAIFLPNILILFLGISLMEDTGYMARAAFIMDKFMHAVGLHGKSFIPMLMGLGCSVPAIMAARTLESERDRIKTILLTPLISCSARLPVYILFAGALFPRHAGNVVFLFQFVFGTLAFLLMGFIFKHTLFRGEDYPFVMELPPYRLPTGRSVAIHMWHKAEHYLKKMGGVVLLFSIALWFAGNYPHVNAQQEQTFAHQEQALKERMHLNPQGIDDSLSQMRIQHQAQRMQQTYIGQVGQLLEPAVKPLGFDWRGAVALVTGFVAKEVVVSSMGVLYAVDDEATEESLSLRAQIAQNFTPLSGFAFMLFVLLYTPCIVAFITSLRELKNWKWSLFSIGYQLVLAWSVAFVVYQGGRLIGLG